MADQPILIQQIPPIQQISIVSEYIATLIGIFIGIMLSFLISYDKINVREIIILHFFLFIATSIPAGIIYIIKAIESLKKD